MRQLVRAILAPDAKAGTGQQQFDNDEPLVVLCDPCAHSLRYTVASIWKWFGEYRDRLIQEE